MNKKLISKTNTDSRKESLGEAFVALEVQAIITPFYRRSSVSESSPATRALALFYSRTSWGFKFLRGKLRGRIEGSDEDGAAVGGARGEFPAPGRRSLRREQGEEEG